MDFTTIVNNLFEDYGAALFHDTVYEATNVSHSEDKLKEIFYTLPKNIQMTAMEWGLSDTVFRDEAYVFIKEKTNGRNETIND